MLTHNPIICAIDTNDLEHAKHLTRQVRQSVGAIKIGLEFFTAHGHQGIKQLAKSGVPIFLDLKFHDIPNTVAGSVRSVIEINSRLRDEGHIGIFMLTIHTSGGLEMCQRAVAQAKESALAYGISPPFIAGVTLLTSLDQSALDEIGYLHHMEDQVLHLAELGIKAGLDALVCSPHEIATIRQRLGNETRLVVPGIRPIHTLHDDQKRIMSPQDALDLGADYLVIGRPITRSENPEETAAMIAESLEGCRIT